MSCKFNTIIEDNKFVIVGYGGNEWGNNRKGILMAVDANGSKIWKKTFPYFSFHKRITTTNGAIVFVRYTNLQYLKLKEVTTVKFGFESNRIC